MQPQLAYNSDTAEAREYARLSQIPMSPEHQWYQNTKKEHNYATADPARYLAKKNAERQAAWDKYRSSRK